jgi:hypothetical protein
MVQMVQAALDELAVPDRVLVAGEFAPRGHSGSAFVGGFVGDAAGSLGMAAGSIGAQRYVEAESGLPATIVVGVSDSTVYGIAANRSRRHSGLLFRLPRAGLTAEVHQRVNVRILELVDEASGSRLELEGNRLPVTHSKDVIEILR